MVRILLALLLAQADQDLKRIREVLNQAEETAGTVKEPYLESKAWAEVAEVRAASGDGEGALKLLEKIPNAYEKSLGYASVAKALAKAGNGEGARRVAMRGLKACDEGDQDFKSPNAYAHLVIALAEAGDLDGAVKRLEAVPGGPTGQEFAIKDVAFVLAKKGRIEGAIALLARGPVDDWTYVRGIEDMVKEADPASTLPLVKRISEMHLRGKALESIVKEQVRRGRMDDAVATARTIEDPSYKVSTLLWVADELRERKKELASELLSLANSSADAISEPSQKCRAWAGLARSWAKSGKAESAARSAELSEKAQREITEEWMRRWALREVAAAHAAGGKLAKALEIAATDTEAAREEILTEIARSQVEVGDIQGALKTVEPCKNSFHRSQILFAVSKRETKPQEVRKRLHEAAGAMDTVETSPKSLNDIRNGNPNQEHLYHLMEAMAKAGDFEGSVKVGQRIRKDMGHWFGGFALRRAAEWQAEAEKLEEALAWIDKIDEALPKSLALIGAAEGALKRVKR